MQGIYKIGNTVNEKVYAGQSVDISRRWVAHLRSSFGGKTDSNSKLHSAMRELGVENFFIEVIEEVEDAEKLDEREIYWIQFYNARENGYNTQKGGTGVRGENNPRAILGEDDIITIRSMYNQKIPFREAYKHFEKIITKRGFQKVWSFETWKNIMPEVYTEENKLWHATASKGFAQEKGVPTLERMLSEEEVTKIKQLASEGKPYAQIAKLLGRAPSTVRKYALGLNGKKPTPGIAVKNVETGKIFDSYKAAAKWAGCERHTISRFLEGRSRYGHAGYVPETKEKATWTTEI